MGDGGVRVYCNMTDGKHPLVALHAGTVETTTPVSYTILDVVYTTTSPLLGVYYCRRSRLVHQCFVSPT